MTLYEVDEAANRIREEVDPDANIIFGSTFDATMQGRMRVSVVATGIAAMAAQQPAPNYLKLDVNRPIQTGQPALSRPARAAGRPRRHADGCRSRPPMPAAPPPPPAPVDAGSADRRRLSHRPRRRCRNAVVTASSRRCRRKRRFAAPDRTEVAVAPAPVAPPAPAPAPAPAPTPAPAPAAAAAPAPAPQRPLVDETDWRVSRPAATPAGARHRAEARPIGRAPGRRRQPLAEPVPAHHRRILVRAEGMAQP